MIMFARDAELSKMGQIQYSEKYFDDIYEYRHVVLPAEVAKMLPKNRLLSEVSYPYMYRHNAMISEVLATLKEPNGSDSGATAKHIEGPLYRFILRTFLFCPVETSIKHASQAFSVWINYMELWSISFEEFADLNEPLGLPTENESSSPGYSSSWQGPVYGDEEANDSKVTDEVESSHSRKSNDQLSQVQWNSTIQLRLDLCETLVGKFGRICKNFDKLLWLCDMLKIVKWGLKLEDIQRPLRKWDKETKGYLLAKEHINLVEECSDKLLVGTPMTELTTMKYDGLRSMQQHDLDMTHTATRLNRLGMTVGDSFLVKLTQEETRLKAQGVHTVNLVGQGANKILKPYSKKFKKKGPAKVQQATKGDKKDNKEYNYHF
ncbi:hypothetical protein BUALT_Bualt07G0053100 [Buddleja alternifolia]|uniref:Cyclin-dependent kinases regulatory subunit n=1 Tax=Buddleja alternifolia TaxID=168488 RepID=A0AAV6X8G2_9LAMI|nr:hypothetical protein BUALT_Bualt07G0053100 [Buddleja alternifolia]